MRVLVALVVTVAVLGAAPPATGEEAWVWPVEGRVLTPYSNDNGQPYAGGMHRGIDIAAATGASVVAARAGTVTHAGVVGSSGLTVAVRTADGRHVASYLHLSAVAVKKGDPVAAGAPVGAVGTTGRRSVAEPHLHFGVRLGDREDHYVDPLTLLPALPVAQSPAPVAPVPVPAPLRAEAQPVPRPVGARVPVVPRAAPAPRPVRVRPRGTVHPGPVVAPRAAAAPAAVRHAGPKLRPVRVPAGPAPRRAPAVPSAHPAASGHVTSPATDGRSGQTLVVTGLGLVALVLFGNAASRALARANEGVNGGAAAAMAWLRAAASFGRVRPTISSSGARRR